LAQEPHRLRAQHPPFLAAFRFLEQVANMTSAEDRYVFHCEWFDTQADVIRRYMLTFYPRDNSIEMWDTRNKRSFLKRSEYAEVGLKDLYLGAVVTILARQLKVIEYADEYTRKALETHKERTLALIKPDAYFYIGEILKAAYAEGFVVARMKMIRLDQQRAEDFCRLLPPGEASPDDPAHLTSDVCVVMELVGIHAVQKWAAAVGPSSPSQAKGSAPQSLRARFGTDQVRNAVHASDSQEAADSQLEFFFGKAWPTTALFNNCTLCIIRPHALVSSGGDIVTRILKDGFEISAMCLWCMKKAVAEEFLEVYKGVLPEYHDMVSQLSNGPSLVMEVRQESAVESFRKLAGPHDPEVAKHLRPNTLRAQFGLDRVRNAIHCTDLPEDGLLEVEYFFNILYNKGDV